LGASDKQPPAAPRPAAPAPAAKPAASVKPDTPLARVNGKAITKGEFEQAYRGFMKGAHQQGAKQPPPEFRSQFLQQLVNQEVVYQEAAKKPPKDLAGKVDEEFKRLKAGFPSPQAFQEALKADGLTEKALRELVLRQATIRAYVEREIVPKITVTDAEGRKFYDQNKEKMKMPEQVRASHVLLAVPPEAKAEDKKKALAKATEIQKKAAKGEDFAKLAAANSQDPGSAKNGGDLGYFSGNQMVPPFTKAAFALKVGQVSDVVETSFGYHVIKLTDRKAARQATYEEQKDQIQGFLKNQALAQALTRRSEDLKKKAKVEILVAKP
jgi:peptidyl-prolyl cis-trans isomerase C